MEPRQYVIKSLDDFRRIPADRLDVCLREFGQAIQLHASLCEIATSLGCPVEDVPTMKAFEWKDDGTDGIDINFTVNGESILHVRSVPEDKVEAEP